MYQYSKSILLSLIILFSVSKPTFSKPSQATGDELPAFVQNHLQLSAANYSAYQNKMNSKAGGAFVSMGNDPNCSVDINIANIQQVIDSGATEIRLADNASYNEDIFISNKSINRINF